MRYVVKGMDKLVINGKGSVFRSKLVNLVTSRCGYASGGAHNTAHTGTFAAFRYWNGSGNDGTKIIQPSGTPSIFHTSAPIAPRKKCVD